MSNTKRNQIFNFTVIVSVLTLLVILIYYSNNKFGYHMDELLTYGLSNSFFKPFIFDRYNEWIQPSYYSEYLTVSDSQAFSFDSVFYNQANDVHPPLYYFAFHFISSLFPTVFSKWIGIGVNVVFYFSTLFGIHLIMLKLTENKWLSFITAMFWALSMGAITSVMYIRMYAMFSFALVLFLYINIHLYLNNKNRFKDYLFLFLSAVFGIMTQYYFLIAAFFISAVSVSLYFIEKRWKELSSFTLSMIGSLAVSVMLFPPIIDHILSSSRGKEAFNNLSNESNNNAYIEFIDKFLFGGLLNQVLFFIVAIVILLIVHRIYLKDKLMESSIGVSFNGLRNFKLTLMFLIPAIFYTLMINQISPYDSVRYIIPIFPVITTGFIFLVFWITSRISNLTGKVTTFLLIILITSAGFKYNKVGYLYQDHEQIRSSVNELSDNSVLFIVDAPRRVSGNLIELKEFKEIYPFVMSNENDDLPEQTKIGQEESIVIYIHQNFDQKLIIENIIDTYGYLNYEELFLQNGSTAYLFNK